jgi:succinylarginine dihydrolase
MGAHMKTTIDITDALFNAAKLAAQQRDTTLRALVELGLRQVLEAPSTSKRTFNLRKASFRGRGLQKGAQGASWEQLRDMAYGGRDR